MKKHFVILLAALAVMAGFSSCSSDPDEDKAIALSGEWEGNWGMWYEDEFGHIFDADYSYIQLIPDYAYATHGIGYQEDYYSWDTRGRVMSYYRYLWYRFDWEIKNGVLYLTYYHDRSLDTYIRDYRLSNNYFSGYFGRTNNTFRLAKLSNFYNWRPAFAVSIYYGYDIYGPYSKPYEGETRSNTDEKAPTIVRVGSYMREAAE